MILLLALFVIAFEAIGEGFLKRHLLLNFIFKWWIQIITSFGLGVIWFLIVRNMTYIPDWKLIVGFVFVRFMIFDIIYNLANGQRWFYYGTKKLYDRIMTKLGSWGWFMKIVCGIVGIVFLIKG